MKIIIAGCGIVGTVLTERLAAEKHNVTVIDNDADHLSYVSNNFDVLTIHGDATSPDVLQEADIADTDLLIAVTGHDSHNLVMCMVAKKMGVASTIARIRDGQSTKAANLLKEEAGLSFIINPEFDCAREILNSLKYKYTDQIEPLAKGFTDILTCSVRPGAIIDGCKIRELRSVTGAKVLCCAIKRGDEIFIPAADTIIMANDKLSFIASSNDATQFFRKLNYDTGRVENITIIGGSKLGVFLSRKALENGIPVKVVDWSRDKCKDLLKLLPGAEIVHGDGTDTDLLEEEGILESSAVVSATDEDSTNIMISMYVSKVSPDCRVVTKIKKSDFEDMIYNLQIGSVFNPKYITVDNIMRYVRARQNSFENEIESVVHVINNKVAVLEFNIHEDMPHLNVPLKKIRFKKNLLIASILRKGKVFIPTGDDDIEAGDLLIVATTNKEIGRFSEIFA